MCSPFLYISLFQLFSSNTFHISYQELILYFHIFSPLSLFSLSFFFFSSTRSISGVRTLATFFSLHQHAFLIYSQVGRTSSGCLFSDHPSQPVLSPSFTSPTAVHSVHDLSQPCDCQLLPPVGAHNTQDKQKQLRDRRENKWSLWGLSPHSLPRVGLSIHLLLTTYSHYTILPKLRQNEWIS